MSGSGIDFTTTPYLALYKPIAGMDVGTWGLHWNANADVLDSALQAHSDTLAGGPWLPLAGNKTVTGPVVFNGALSGTAFGTAPTLVPRFTDTGSGFPMLALTNRIVIRRATPAATDFTSLQLDRTSTFSGGNTSQRNSLIVLAETAAAGDATVNNPLISTVTTNGNAGGQAIAGLFQVTRNPGCTDFVWAMITDAIDKTGLGTAASGANNLLAQEVNVEANGPDDRSNPMTYGGKGVRRGMHFSAMRYDVNNTAQTEFSCALAFSTNTLSAGFPIDPYTNWQQIIGFSPNSQVRNVLDTRGAITPAGSSNPVSAVTMTAGHVIDFNGGPALDSAPGNYLQYRGGKLYYVVGGVDKLSIDASGNVRAAGTVTGSVAP